MHLERTVLVIGGLGFIGSAFLRQRVVADTSTMFVNMDAVLEGANPNSVKSIRGRENYREVFGDAANIYDMNAVIKNTPPVTDIVVFAAHTDVDFSLQNPYAVIKNNVNLILNVVDQMRLHLPHARLLYVSTDEVYGPVEIGDAACVETSKENPTNPYSVSKRMCEDMVRVLGANYNLDFVITRGANTFGPGQATTKLIPKTLLSLATGNPVVVYGDGTATREWLPVDDHAQMINNVLKYGVSGETYNLTTEVSLSINEVVEILGYGKKVTPKIHYIPGRSSHDKAYRISGAKYRTLMTLPEPDPEERKAYVKALMFQLAKGRYPQDIY